MTNRFGIEHDSTIGNHYNVDNLIFAQAKEILKRMKGRPASDCQMMVKVDHVIFQFLNELLFHFSLVVSI